MPMKIPKLTTFVLVLLAIVSEATAQDTTDVVRLRNLSYMTPEHIARSDCDNIMDNFTARICSNLAFQKADAELNELYVTYLDRIESDSIRQEEMDYHAAWVNHRRRLSHEAADGYRGHMLGLVYLGHMIRITEIRIEELKFLAGER